jgi:adhesin transport system outer membrane protein
MVNWHPLILGLYQGVMMKRSIFTICLGLAITSSAMAENLQDALLQTLHTNPNLLATEKDRCAITQALRGAKGGYLPTLDADAGYGEEYAENPLIASSPNNSLNENTLERREAGLKFDQMIFDGFATSSEVKRNKARLSSADYKVLGTAQDVSLNATETYLNVLKEQEFINIAKNNLSIHQQIRDLISKRSQSGVDQSADLTQAEGRLSLAQSNLTAEQANLIDANSNYLQVVGSNPMSLIMPQAPSSQFMPTSENQAVQMAVANHPILKSAKEDMAAAYAQHEASKSKNYPRFDLQLSARRDDNLDGIEGQNNDAQAMVRMNYNLYHGGSDKSAQNETAYLYQESAEVMHKTYRQVVNNAQLSWNAYDSAEKQLPLLKAHRDDAQKAYQSYSDQFKLGKRTLLDLLNAENEYYQASRSYSEGEYNAKFAKYRVLNAVGSLIQAEHINFYTQSANT